uniref:GEO12045p1 n=2 Tax=Drosophila melanogaster TaxID=7227 RepID=Q8IR47_DROME|eukprot:NP_727787.1 hog [Drosophila melanogaster]
MGYYLKHVMTGYRVYLNTGIHLLGKSGACNVVLTYDNMSDIHAVVVVRNGRIFIKDLESIHGIYLNFKEHRLGSEFYEIFVGDDVAFGVATFGQELGTPLTYGCFTVRSEDSDFDLDFSDSEDGFFDFDDDDSDQFYGINENEEPPSST